MKKFLITSALVAVIGLSTPAFAHEGEDHAAAPGTEETSQVTSIIELSDTAINNLGIKTVKASHCPARDNESM
jgi:hypothetical protein